MLLELILRYGSADLCRQRNLLLQCAKLCSNPSGTSRRPRLRQTTGSNSPNRAKLPAQLKPTSLLDTRGDSACQLAQMLDKYQLSWLEEPLRADRPLTEWVMLGQHCATPLAAGENVTGKAAFAAMLDLTPVAIAQPDIAKWGGISGCWEVIQLIQLKGRQYYPHYLGAGVGLLASAHLLAAVNGGGGMLEVDSNPNRLRSSLVPFLKEIKEGGAFIGNIDGLGIPDDLDRICEGITLRISH